MPRCHDFSATIQNARDCIGELAQQLRDVFRSEMPLEERRRGYLMLREQADKAEQMLRDALYVLRMAGEMGRAAYAKFLRDHPELQLNMN